MITRFPAEKLLVAGAHYVTVDGPLAPRAKTKRRRASDVLEMVEASARPKEWSRQVAASRAVQKTHGHSVIMPALEMAQETGKLLSWRKKEGDDVAKGEPLLEIETDKAVVEIESPADGIQIATAHPTRPATVNFVGNVKFDKFDFIGVPPVRVERCSSERQEDSPPRLVIRSMSWLGNGS